MSTKPIAALTGRTVRCMLFDLGDTLWSRKDMFVWEQVENASNTRAVALIRKRFGPSCLPQSNEVALGKRLRESVDECLRDCIRREPELEPHGGLAIIQALQQWGIEGVDIASGEAIFEALRIRIPESRPLFDDVLPTLDTLRRRGFQLGVVSNRHWGGEIFQEDLRTLGLLNYFDLRHMAISVDLGVRKPNPAIFLHVLNALNTAPEHAVMVGDSLLSDILGARTLGIFTIWKPKPGVYAQAHLIASGTAAKAHQFLTPAESSPGRFPDDLPPGMHISDDDYVLAHIQSRAGKWDQHLYSEVKPDLIIENLHDLLDIFIEVGEQ